jgi:hypothetical protein
MMEITLDHQKLRDLVKFTDPLIHSLEKEEDILSYINVGELRPPSLVEHHGQYLVFNGNHRVLVAINRRLTITCRVLEDLDDVRVAQADEKELSRDLASVKPLTFQGIVDELVEGAKEHGHQNPDHYVYDEE